MLHSAASRIFAVGATRNFRHMGGYHTASGRITRGDRLFRSDWLDLSRGPDAEQFRALGVRQIFDFRSDAERARQPLMAPVDRSLEVHAMSIDSGSMGSYLEQVAALEADSIDCKSAMTQMYYEMLDVAQTQLRRSFSALAAGDGPALMMCTTGKDRTGIAAALLLTALGVSHEHVMADYLISAAVYQGHEDEFARRHGYERTGHSLERFRDVFTVHRQYLEAVWRRARQVAESVDAFILRELLEDGAQEQLRQRFTQKIPVDGGPDVSVF